MAAGGSLSTVPKLPDFSVIYGKKTRLLGRDILYVEAGPSST